MATIFRSVLAISTLMFLMVSCQAESPVVNSKSDTDSPDSAIGGFMSPANAWYQELLGDETAEFNAFDLGPAIEDLKQVSEYTMVSGDNVSNIAKNYGLTVETLLSFNKIKSPRTLRPGQVLKIPSRDGILLELQEPESIESIAETYEASAELIRLANNAVGDTTTLTGDIFVPGARMDPLELRKLLGEYFLWPTKGGRISSYFGYRKDPFSGAPSSHSGVDIANYHGAPVLAAGEGRVTHTGYDRILGNHIKVDQGQGFVVVYGHLSAISTKVGAKVVPGQLIGKVGNTGYSTGPHLHFAVWRWGKLLNPMMLFG